MTPVQDLSGTWSVAAFYRAIADAHFDLEQHLREDLDAHFSSENFVPALTACGALPEGWPEVRARRLALAMIWVMDWRDTPHYRDTFFTDARGRIVYHDGWDDLRAWMEELGFEEADDDLPGSLTPLLVSIDSVVSMCTLTDRLGPDRIEAFVTRVRQEGSEAPEAYYLGKAADLGRYAGLKYENVAMLEQANRDEAEACAMLARYQQWLDVTRDEPPASDDTE